ncbi:MAG: FAD-dependent monooxygenase [Gemmatimonas sp.]
MLEHSVVIAGGGPTGLMLAAELAIAGVDVAIVERRADQTLTGSRAGGLSSRSLEILDQRGVVDRFLAEGQKAQITGFATTRIDISDFPTRHNYGLALWQNHIERILADWVHELGVAFYRSREVVSFADTVSSIDIQLSDNTTIRAQYLVGCDGGRSTVRKLAGIDFPGWEATVSNLIAEVAHADNAPLGIHQNKFGTHAFGRIEYDIVDGKVVFRETGPIRVMVTEEHPNHNDEPTFERVRETLIAAAGSDYGIRNPIWISRFTDATRQAAQYRKSRVLLAGDAAHIHSPIGGQGMNTGLQDAVNLGWKLAQVVNGVSSERLLDTYHDERHPVAARMLRMTMAQVALHRADERSKAASEFIVEMLRSDETRKRIGAEMAQLHVRYDFGDGHPLLGRRMPDLELNTRDGATRVYQFLQNARGVLIKFGLSALSEINTDPLADRVTFVEASYSGAWELPGVGSVTAPLAVHIRPDGHVAWVGVSDHAGAEESLHRWHAKP